MVLALLVGACGDDDDDDAAPPTTATTTTTVVTTPTDGGTPDAPESLRLTDECAGIGPVTDAELTWIADGRIWASTLDGSDPRCLAEFVGYPSLAWGGEADRLLAGERSVLLESGPVDVVPGDRVAIGWSRPTGRALLARGEDGALSKLSLNDEPRLELALPFTTGDVLYHPAGTAIALVSQGSESSTPPDLLLASNRGDDARWLVANESANRIVDLEFTGDGALLFIAEHGGQWHLHRLVLGSDELETLLETDDPMRSVVASQTVELAVAVDRGRCDDPGPLWASITGDVLELEGTPVERGSPVGWLPSGELVVLVRDAGCDDTTGDLYVVGATVELVAEDVEAAAVRAPLPPAPPPPPEIEAAPA